jgi:hypothetical protein
MLVNQDLRTIEGYKDLPPNTEGKISKKQKSVVILSELAKEAQKHGVKPVIFVSLLLTPIPASFLYAETTIANELINNPENPLIAHVFTEKLNAMLQSRIPYSNEAKMNMVKETMQARGIDVSNLED